MTRRLVLLLAGLAAFAAVAGRVQAADPTDRVGFPAEYPRFTVLRTANMTQRGLLGTIYGNTAAASVHDVTRLPYPNGAVIVMEWATPLKAADGTPLAAAGGLWKKGAVVRIDVMRREAGYGAAYGAKRAGEWEFAYILPPLTPRQIFGGLNPPSGMSGETLP